MPRTRALSRSWRNSGSALAVRHCGSSSVLKQGRGKRMGCVYNRGTRTLPNFWINWREHGKNRYQRIGPDKALAKATMQQIEAGVQKKKLSRRYGIETEAAPAVPTFDAAADAFIERRKAPDADGKPMRRSWKDDLARLDNYLRPRFGRKHLDELHEGDMRQLI